MTRSFLVAASLWLTGLSALWPQSDPVPGRISIPRHPRELIFAPSSWRPPTAASHRVELPGGATAYVIEDHTLPLVDIVVVARAGSYHDPRSRPGVSRLTATMLRRGGAGDLEPTRFDDRAAELGARLTSDASVLFATASLRCTSAVLDEAAPLLLDMIQSPRFDSARLGSLKRNLAEGMARRNVDPLAVLDREWDWLIFGTEHFSTHPLRPSDLAALTPAALEAFHRAHWRPANLTLAVAGAIDGKQLKLLVGPQLRQWAEALGLPDPARAWPPAGPRSAPRSGLFHVEREIAQAKIAIGRRAPAPLPTAEERAVLEVMAEILGGRGAISRLSGRLRSAEGLVYRTTTRLEPGDLWPADYRIFFDTQARKATPALAATIQEIERLRRTLPHAEELAVAKRELIARQRQDFDTAEEAVGYLVQDALVGRPESYRLRYRELVEAVTPEKIRAAALRHLDPAEMTTLVVGPWSSVSGGADAEGWTRLERLLGSRVEHLPQRDPSTLEPLPGPGS